MAAFGQRSRRSGEGPLFRTRPTSSVPSDGTVADILDARARRREARPPCPCRIHKWTRLFAVLAGLPARGLQLPKEQLSTDSLQDIPGAICIVTSVTVTQMFGSRLDPGIIGSFVRNWHEGVKASALVLDSLSFVPYRARQQALRLCS